MDKRVLKEIKEIQEMMGIDKVARPIMKAFKMNVPEEMTEVEEGEMTEQYKIPTLQEVDTLCDIKCGKKAARSGSKGDVVEVLQQGLIDCGYPLDNYGADGKYGKEVTEAVRKFQDGNDLTVDGVIGPETIGLMIENECIKDDENCNCDEKKSFDDDAISDFIDDEDKISDEQRRGSEAADEYEKEQSKISDDEMMKNLPIKGDGYECEKCPKYINRMPGPNRGELTKFEAWCINNCNSKVVV